jgi:hypothetical protein
MIPATEIDTLAIAFAHAVIINDYFLVASLLGALQNMNYNQIKTLWSRLKPILNDEEKAGLIEYLREK